VAENSKVVLFENPSFVCFTKHHSKRWRHLLFASAATYHVVNFENFVILSWKFVRSLSSSVHFYDPFTWTYSERSETATGVFAKKPPVFQISP